MKLAVENHDDDTVTITVTTEQVTVTWRGFPEFFLDMVTEDTISFGVDEPFRRSPRPRATLTLRNEGAVMIRQNPAAYE